jgi:GH3 auxin-responsive promoter
VKWSCLAANSMWWAANAPAYLSYRAALRRPEQVQSDILMRYLRQNADTEYGRRWAFDQIGSPDEYRRRVPLTDYDDIAPLIERIAAGEPNILTREPVERLHPSSGSTAAAKLIPYTKRLRAEFARGIAPWAFDLFRSEPSLAAGPAYWSITPAMPPPVDSRVPVGFDDDSSYLGVGKRLVDATLAVPGDVARLSDMEAFHYTTLRFLVSCRELRFISIWHPSFLSLLLAQLPAHWPALISDIAAGGLTLPVDLPGDVRARLASRLRPEPHRAAELERIGPDDLERIWPRLRVVSCWADGHAALSVPELRRLLPSVRIQPKGLIATEGIVTLPFEGQNTLAVRSHFFEFLADDGVARFAHELEPGAEYRVVLTTGGGLYRYCLHDRVQVAGFSARTPVLRFLGKEDHVSDLCGEKLSEGFVARALQSALNGVEARFAMLAPDGEGYTLFVRADTVPPGLPGAVDAALCANPHYRYCVELGQLQRARVFAVDGAASERFLEHSRRLGRRLGDVKPTPLSTCPDWPRVFQGSYVPGD